MKFEVKVPAVGESINEVTIAQWLKKEGESVEMDEVLCELESDKATFELTAERAGTLHIIAEEGDTLEIGALICDINESGEAAEAPSPAKAEESAPAAPVAKAEEKTVEMVVPALGESINEVTVGSWIKEDGDIVELDVLGVGGLLCKIHSGGDVPAAKSEATSSTEAPAEANGPVAGHPSPAAAKILAEKGISPSEVKGTGVDGRITKEDAVAAKKSAPAPAPSKAPAKAEAPAPAPAASGDRVQERKKLSPMRRTIARRLVEVKNETAMLTTFNEVDMKPIMDLRKQYKDKFKEKYEVGLGFMSFFTKASTIALQEWPAVNAQIDGNEIIYNNFADISIAVSSPKGLVVPVIRNAEQLSFDGIEKEVVRLALKARAGKLTIEEMTGGTFTLTNGGIFGSMLSTPIINAPQSAILGMHNIVQRPVAINGQVEIRPIMYLALSYDHRVIDGRESVSFLKRIKELLEDPTRMLLEL